MAAFGLRFNIRKFLKEKFSGKIALAYFMYYKSLQVGQLPQAGTFVFLAKLAEFDYPK